MVEDVFSGDGSLVIMGSGGCIPYVDAELHDCRAVNGDVRLNNNQMEVYSNGCWMTIPNSTVDVRLDFEDKAAIEWAKRKMKEEEKEKELIAKHPALKSAKEKFETIKALVNDDN